jgi:zinc/manganese transport system permease protein
MTLELLGLPFLACLVLTGIHTYLGLHVLARGVIFVDLALAQVAALGMTAALLAGHSLQSSAASWHALAFTAAGAAVLALSRERRHGAQGLVPQEAVVGIVYAVAAAMTVLVLDRAPQGTEQIKQLLVGSILAVTPSEVAGAAVLYAGVGAFHWVCRRPLLALSFGPPADAPNLTRRHAAVRNAVDEGRPAIRSRPLGWPARAWDFTFYVSFGLVVTSSVRIAGVLLVFSYLIVPAVIAVLLTPTLFRRLLIGWGAGFAVSVVGLGASYTWDLPTGPAVVTSFGAALLLIAGIRAARRLVAALRADGPRALAGLVGGLGVLIALAGALLVLFPGADHYWLDALETVAPSIQTAFLTPGERETREESKKAIIRGHEELHRLRTLAADVQWGSRELPAEQHERLRQFIAGRDEVLAGDRLVLATLRRHARERQRVALGLPLFLSGASLTSIAVRARR